MTENQRRIPRSMRAAVVAALLALVCVVSTVAGAAPPSKEDVQRAKDRLERVEDELGRIRGDLAATQLQLNEAASAIEQQQIALEQVTFELARTQEELDRARARHDKIVGRLHDRAVMAYMTGPASSIDFLLDAENVADLTDRLAYVDALAQLDAELGVKVANLKNRLTAAQAKLEGEQSLKLRELEKARAKEREVAALLDEQQGLLDRQEGLFTVAERTFKTTKADRDAWLERQAALGDAIGGRVWDGEPLVSFDHLFEVCPVGQPRGFGDGFGAPRYGGGYHLHKGVDIVAPTGTDILAPFDGLAYTSSNGLGGNVVFVVGAQGTVYNAHLSEYTSSSNGSVSAGDVIGKVGSTGYSSTPHDHFEFHPHSMPVSGSWPVSAYGHAVIEDAINPYPMLIQGCG